MRKLVLLAVVFVASACAPKQDPGVPIPPPVPDNEIPSTGN